MRPGHSDTFTQGIRVRVAAQYVEENSDPDAQQWFYAYRVIISNEGSEQAQLLSRHWKIIDSENRMEEVRGPGVVGEQPVLLSGNRFEYTSYCPLSTAWGTMEGSYEMRREDGSTFSAAVGRFFLAQTVAPMSSLDAPSPEAEAEAEADRG